MSYGLDCFARDAHAVLAEDPGPVGREAVRELLRRLLVDQEFIATHLGDHEPERRVLYEDPDLGFLIVGHVLKGFGGGGPHDHGQTWAIYGQAVGETIMDHWEAISPATPDSPGAVRLVETYRLTAGSAHVYNERDIHSPRGGRPAKLVRIEGAHVSDRLNYCPI